MTELLQASKMIIQKDLDNQLVTEIKEKVDDLYDTLVNSFINNVVDNKLYMVNNKEEFDEVGIQHEYLLRALKNIEDAFLNIETAFNC